MCARAREDLAQGTLIQSFTREDGHWIQAVQPERIRVTARLPRGGMARRHPARSSGHAPYRSAREGELMKGHAADASDRQGERASCAEPPFPDPPEPPLPPPPEPPVPPPPFPPAPGAGGVGAV
jgi:hypothetical protein